MVNEHIVIGTRKCSGGATLETIERYQSRLGYAGIKEYFPTLKQVWNRNGIAVRVLLPAIR